MTHGISFEPADLSDLDAIKELFRETVKKHEDAESISFDEIYAWFDRKLQKHVRDADTYIFTNTKTALSLTTFIFWKSTEGAA